MKETGDKILDIIGESGLSEYESHKMLELIIESLIDKTIMERDETLLNL